MIQLIIYSERNWIHINCFSSTVSSHRNGNHESFHSIVTCLSFVMLFIVLWVRVGKHIFYTWSSVIFWFEAFFFFPEILFLALCKELLELHFFEICLLILAYFILFLFFFLFSLFFFCFLGCFPKGGQSG